MIKAKVTFLLLPSLLKMSCPNFPKASDCSRLATYEMPDRSAPAAKIKGFPIIAIATESLLSAAVIASFSAFRD